jgi:RNA polymerase-binding transcription factor DksA
MSTTTEDRLRKTRARLVARVEQLRDRIRHVQLDLGRETNPLPRDAPDAAVVIENDEILQAIDEAARRELIQIEHALERLDAGKFAECEVCGADIGAARMSSVPHATRCVHCAQNGAAADHTASIDFTS